MVSFTVIFFFFLGWWGEPGSPWEMPDALLRSAVWAQLPRVAENEEKTIQEEFWQKWLQNMLADWETLFNERRNCKKN